MGFWLAFKTALLSSVANWLLVFVPVGIAVRKSTTSYFHGLARS